MGRQTLNVAFAARKGGSDKTAITALVISYLHYHLRCPLAMIDCDFPWYSLYEMRERDSRAVLENECLKWVTYERMRQPGYAVHPVRKCRMEQAPDVIRGLAAKGCHDLSFFDLSGTVNSVGIPRTIAQMNYIFAPVSAGRTALEGTLSFLDVLQRMTLGKGTNRLKGLHFFWSQVDKRETSGLYKKYGQVIANMGLLILQTRIPDTKRFHKRADGTGRTAFHSTLPAPDRRMLAGSDIPGLTREIAIIFKLEGYEEAVE